MPWTETTRKRYQRTGLRYASDLTDAEWSLIARYMPRPRRRGRPRTVDLREIVQAVIYIASTGCQWRALPKTFPPYTTVQGYFYAWRDSGRWQRIVNVLVRPARRKLGRRAVPTAAIIDSQTVPTTEAGGPRGFDAGKRVRGRKRHIATDTNGFLLAVHIHPANVQDVHGAVPLLEGLGRRFPKLRHVVADRVYRGPQLVQALAPSGPWTIKIVERPPGVKGFQLLPRRWAKPARGPHPRSGRGWLAEGVERTFAWLGRCRRLAKDFEASPESQAAWVYVAHLRLLVRRLAQAT